MLAVVLALGFGAAELQHGYLPGGDIAFPLAGVKVPIWHLVWMGFWTGYTMAVVGEAAGIFARALHHVDPAVQHAERNADDAAADLSQPLWRAVRIPPQRPVQPRLRAVGVPWRRGGAG